MKANHTFFLLPVALIVAAGLRPSEDAPSVDVQPELVLVAAAPEVLHPLESHSLPVEPFSPKKAPQIVEAPGVTKEPKTPFQPVEERGDAMLFDIGALGGTPFGISSVMPFD